MKKQLNLSTAAIIVFVLMLTLLSSGQALAKATVTILNADDPGEGFNDPTPVAPVGGNPGTTKGQQRLIAFQRAADIWGEELDSNVPIIIEVSFDPIAPNTLGFGGSKTIFSEFPGQGFHPGAEFPETWYHSALGDKRAGFDLDPSDADMFAEFNSDADFYLGLDNNHGAQIDLIPVVLHELAHGLGFNDYVNDETGEFYFGFTDIYTRHLLDTTTGLNWHQMTAAQRRISARNYGRVVWDGEWVRETVPEVLSFGSPEVRFTAPGFVRHSHFSIATFGPPFGTPATAEVVAALDAADAAGPTTTDGCSALTNAAEVAGKIAVITRGSCVFTVKTKNAQNAGAIAVVIQNNVAGAASRINGNDPTITIPTVGVSLADGDMIRARLPGVNGWIGVDQTIRAGADSLGRARLYMPNPVALGSSIGHFDRISSRNLLMEPNLEPDLTHSVKAPEDLTLALMRDIGWFPDADLDGIASDADCQPNSDLSATVVIDGRDTGVQNTLFRSGCTISDLIEKIAVSSRNHGQFVAGVAKLTNNLVREGVITVKERNEILKAAARAKVPKRGRLNF
jgi:hypothetical protein